MGYQTQYSLKFTVVHVIVIIENTKFYKIKRL